MDPAVAGLVGVGIGGAIGIAREWFIKRTEREQHARQVAMGLAGEIEALISIVEVRKYGDFFRIHAQDDDPLPTRVPSVTVGQNYFSVFDANADKLGLLKGDLPAQVARVYVQARALVDDFQRVSKPGFAEEVADVAERKRLYGNIAMLLDLTLADARQAASALRQFGDPQGR